MELFLLIVPMLCVPLVFRLIYGNSITPKEMLAQAAAGAIIVAIVYNVSTYSQMHDVEILNGKVTNKQQQWVPCSHSYSCNCTTDSKGNTTCQTCYEHPNDWDWDVETSVGTYTVDRIDSRGEDEPPRWTAVQIGEPASLPHSYTNYVRAAPESLFNTKMLRQHYKGDLPAYPEVYDYDHFDHVMDKTGKIADLPVWNNDLALALRDLGPTKQVNIMVIFTDREKGFVDALKGEWIGGKKNDMIVVVGTKDGHVIDWVQAFSWSKHDIVNVALRNDIMNLKTIDRNTMLPTIASDVSQYYERKPMADFAYLKDTISPPLWVLILAMVLATGVSVYLGFYFRDNDPFDTPSYRYRY